MEEIRMKKIILFILIAVASIATAAPRHCRDCSCLSAKEQEFASYLSVSKRRIFCGRFSNAQRQAAMRHADNKICPEEAVVHVMQETGMSLAVKSRRQCGEVVQD